MSSKPSVKGDLGRAEERLRGIVADPRVYCGVYTAIKDADARALLAELARLRRNEKRVEEWLAARNGDNDHKAPPPSALQASLEVPNE